MMKKSDIRALNGTLFARQTDRSLFLTVALMPQSQPLKRVYDQHLPSEGDRRHGGVMTVCVQRLLPVNIPITLWLPQPNA
jgi:hypothetical protein